MLTSQETIKLYLTINKLLYKYSELGKEVILQSRNKRVKSDKFKKLLEVSIAIGMLLESEDPIVLEGQAYPNYSMLEGQDLDKMLDYLTLEYNLDPLPATEFPKTDTTFIQQAIGINVSGTELPSGGGVGFFLTKDLSGNLIWSSEVVLKSDFNLI